MAGLTLFPSNTLQLTEDNLQRITQKALKTVEARRRANETAPSPSRQTPSSPPVRPQRPRLGCDTAVAPIKATTVLISPMDDDYRLSPVLRSSEHDRKSSAARSPPQPSIDPFGSSHSYSTSLSPPRLKSSKSAVTLSPASEKGSWSAWSRVGARMASRPSLDAERDVPDMPWRHSPCRPRASGQRPYTNYSMRSANSAVRGSASSTSSTASPPGLIPDVSRSNSVATELTLPNGSLVSSPTTVPTLTKPSISSETWPLPAPKPAEPDRDSLAEKPSTAISSKESIFTSAEELSKLWELCNGQRVDIQDEPICLPLHIHDTSNASAPVTAHSNRVASSRRRGKEVETPYLTIGPLAQPFYTLFQSTSDPSAKAHVELRRSNPSAKASGISVAEFPLSSITSSSSTSPNPRLHQPVTLPTRTDEVTASFTPRLATLLALDAVHSLTTHPTDHDNNVTAYQHAVAASRQTSQAISDADKRDRTTILFEPAANGYFVCHPAFGLVPVQVDGNIHLPCTSTNDNTKGQSESQAKGTVTLWTPYSSSLARSNAQNKRQHLASLDFTTRTLTLHPEPLRRLAALSLFAVDALVAALLAVTLAEGRRGEALKRLRVAAAMADAARRTEMERAAMAAAAAEHESDSMRMRHRLRKIKSRPVVTATATDYMKEGGGMRAASLDDGRVLSDADKSPAKRFRWWA